MKNHQFLLFSLLMLSGIYGIKAQNLILGATGNTGLSKLFIHDLHFENVSAKPILSGNFGCTFQYKFGQKSSIGIEVIWLQMGGSFSNTDIKLTNEFGAEIGTLDANSTYNFSYLGMPLYYQLHLQSVGLKLGFQPMLLLSGKAKYKSVTKPIVGENTVTSGETKQHGYDNYDYGLKLGIDFSISPKIKIRADLYYGLNELHKDEYFLKHSNQQLTLGLNYVLWLNAEEEKTDGQN